MNSATGAAKRRLNVRRRARAGRLIRALLLTTAAWATVGAGRAETVGGALVKAYLNNPDINTQRAAVRVADENVPKQNAGYLPTVSAEGDFALSRVGANVIGANNQGSSNNFYYSSKPRGVGITANETVFNGNRTTNAIRQAELQVLGSRAQLRNTEQNTLLAGVTAYMDVLRDTAILELDRNNVQVLQEQLRETRDRFTVGEVTRTDVAQAEASLSSSQATALSAEFYAGGVDRPVSRGYRRRADQPCAGQADHQAAAEDSA